MRRGSHLGGPECALHVDPGIHNCRDADEEEGAQAHLPPVQDLKVDVVAGLLRAVDPLGFRVCQLVAQRASARGGHSLLRAPSKDRLWTGNANGERAKVEIQLQEFRPGGADKQYAVIQVFSRALGMW